MDDILTINRITAEVLGALETSLDHQKKMVRVTAEVLGSYEIYEAHNKLINRFTVEVMGDAEYKIRGLHFPTITTVDQSVIFCGYLAMGSRFNLSPRDNTYSGVIIEPHDDDPTKAAIKYIENVSGFLLQTGPLDIYDQKIIVSLVLAPTETRLRVNRENVAFESIGLVDNRSTVNYGDLFCRLPPIFDKIDTEVSEVILFKSAISADNVVIVEDYLQCKWLSADGPNKDNNFCIPVT